MKQWRVEQPDGYILTEGSKDFCDGFAKALNDHATGSYRVVANVEQPCSCGTIPDPDCAVHVRRVRRERAREAAVCGTYYMSAVKLIYKCTEPLDHKGDHHNAEYKLTWKKGEHGPGYEEPRVAAMASVETVIAQTKDWALIDALVHVAVWENDRAVKQALRGQRDPNTTALWETCFRHVFERVLAERPNATGGERPAVKCAHDGMQVVGITGERWCPDCGALGRAIPLEWTRTEEHWTLPRKAVAASMVHVERVDWTVDPETNRCNSSAKYVATVKEVARLIRGQAHTLLAGDTEGAASLIVAQLAHVHGFTPHGGGDGGRGDRLWRALDDLACKAAPVSLGMMGASELHKPTVRARKILDAEQRKEVAGESEVNKGKKGR